MKDYEENYWAKRVGQYNKTSWVKNEDFIDAFLGMLPEHTFNSILEVGVGTGVVAEKVAEKIGPLIGVDISKEMISKIHHPTRAEILQYFSRFSIIGKNSYILKKQSIINWLNNTCNDKTEREKIIIRHRKSSKTYKTLANFVETQNDILVNIIQFIIIGKK